MSEELQFGCGYSRTEFHKVFWRIWRYKDVVGESDPKELIRRSEFMRLFGSWLFRYRDLTQDELSAMEFNANSMKGLHG